MSLNKDITCAATSAGVGAVGEAAAAAVGSEIDAIADATYEATSV